MNDKLREFNQGNLGIGQLYTYMSSWFELLPENKKKDNYGFVNFTDFGINSFTPEIRNKIAVKFVNTLDKEIDVFAYPLFPQKNDEIFKELSNRYFTNTGKDKEIDFIFQPIAHITIVNDGDNGGISGNETSEFLIDLLNKYLKDQDKNARSKDLQKIIDAILCKTIDFYPKTTYSKRSFLINNYIKDKMDS
ncbi:hypothetical protein [Lentilactobacillus kefiri]|uniref:hypothetical protein n=1 Tax=Lentilactobacillus kefiri TaxID=33962 RepID=UPI002073675C|nr:hypothetical protein [Lentilactobacillus kefiri]